MIKVHLGEPLVDRTQDPQDKLRWGVSWGSFLEAGVVIESSEWAVTPESGATLSDNDVTLGATATIVMVSGLNADVVVTNHIVMSDGEEKDFSFRLKKRTH